MNYNYEEKESWFYYSFTTKNYLFLKPKIINQKILAIDFNQEGFITNIQDFDFHKNE
jgi:outer membrane protein assembly factor BamE (lipoprotein component of BamABCDE complex)